MNFIPLIPLPEFVLRMDPKIAEAHHVGAVAMAVAMFLFGTFVVVSFSFPCSGPCEDPRWHRSGRKFGLFFWICAVVFLVFGLYAMGALILLPIAVLVKRRVIHNA